MDKLSIPSRKDIHKTGKFGFYIKFLMLVIFIALNGLLVFQGSFFSIQKYLSVTDEYILYIASGVIELIYLVFFLSILFKRKFS